ncbi:MAG: DUF3426 domain-containing protein [Oleiphilaceae bacterium]|nr:DUF3426 domain-containing protein [Oleiphilaceae bacterium]
MSVQVRHTRCPQCKTRFRVTEEQITVAAGKVRCGQCRTIFNARAHLLSNPPPSFSDSPAPRQDKATRTPEPETKPDSRPGAPEPDSFLSARRSPEPEDDDELIFQDDPEEDATEGHYAGRQQDQQSEYSSSFLSLDEEDLSNWADDRHSDTAPPPVDESWAESLLADDDQDERREGAESRRGPDSRGLATGDPDQRRPADGKPVDRDRDAGKDDTQEADSPPSGSDPTPVDEEDWEAMIDWDSLDNLPEIPDPTAQLQHTALRKPASEPASQPGPTAEKRPSLSLQALQDDDSAPRAHREAGTDWRQLRAEPIAASPVERSPSRYRWWWRALAVLLALALAAQTLWLQREALAMNESLRPLYVQGCQWLGCELPTLVDRNQLVARDLIVRNHPDESGALLVEAQLHNRASFPQPLPAVALSFSNLNGDIVAQRVFRPSQYLAVEPPGEIAANRALPIRLSLKDPGREAISYRIDFLGLPEAD